MSFPRLIATVLIAAFASDAAAYEIRTRFVRRIGPNDVPIPGNLLMLGGGEYGPQRIRVQFGVFDDGAGPAPAGGFVAWNVGEIHVTDVTEPAFTFTRTPGRLAPFTLTQHGNGVPALDPFHDLTEIDCAASLQVPLWPPGSDPDTPPPPIIRGLNDWISVYEFTALRPGQSIDEVTEITISGNLIAAREWRVIGTPVPPTPDEPGQITYAPVPLPPVAFESTLQIRADGIPAPSAALVVVGVSGVMGLRRRR